MYHTNEYQSEPEAPEEESFSKGEYAFTGA